jgi:hypothetical protein
MVETKGTGVCPGLTLTNGCSAKQFHRIWEAGNSCNSFQRKVSALINQHCVWPIIITSTEAGIVAAFFLVAMTSAFLDSVRVGVAPARRRARLDLIAFYLSAATPNPTRRHRFRPAQAPAQPPLQAGIELP